MDQALKNVDTGYSKNQTITKYSNHTIKKKQFFDFVNNLISKKTISIGATNKGALKNGILLPIQGPGYRTFKKERWGTSQLIYTLFLGIYAVNKKFPDTVPLVIGALSKRNGGYFPPHLSHQSGRDMDIGYFYIDNLPVHFLKNAYRTNLDTEKTLVLIEGMLKTGWVKYIFIDYSVQKLLYEKASELGWSQNLLNSIFQYPHGKRYKKTVIRHASGHVNHMHVRVFCSANDYNCKN